MPASRRCIIHIGAPKTGTTFLQRLFFNNRAELARGGLLYPDVSLRGYGHHDLAFLVFGEYPDWATPQPLPLSTLQAQLAEQVQSAESILLSSEDLYLFPNPKGLFEVLQQAGALRDRDPVIIVYVRRQDLAHESWYNQTIKAQGYDHDVESCVAQFHELWDYEKRLQQWAQVFGEHSIIVRPYEKRQFHGGTLTADFFSAVGFGRFQSLDGDGEAVNTSLNRDLLQIQRYINRLPITVQEKRKFHHQLIALSDRTRGTGLFDETPIIGAEMAAAILKSYSDGNKKVAGRYLGRSELFFDQPLHEPVSAPQQSISVTNEKLIYILGWLLTRGR